jgi:hypothetical protein
MAVQARLTKAEFQYVWERSSYGNLERKLAKARKLESSKVESVVGCHLYDEYSSLYLKT